MTDKLTTLSTDLLKIIQSVRRSGMPGPDGLSTTGSVCPVHNQTLCVYSGTFESAHPYENRNPNFEYWSFKHSNEWSVNVPVGKFLRLKISSLLCLI